ncbi:MAG: hypothetical protein KIT31_32475 [Deltaproteobacteria bacterium]|nr:hypothetical protein [Deltaproteobacteria bacterium]
MRADEVFHEVVVATRRAFPPMPDQIVIDRDGILQVVTPSITTGQLNEIVHADLGDRDDAAIEAAIDAAIAQYRSRGLKFRWRVGPLETPADLGARLERRGLTPSRMIGVARSTATPIPLHDPGIEIARVDAANIDTYSDAMAAGWGIDLGPLRDAHRTIVAERRWPQAMYLAVVDGVPAATAAYVALARSAYLVGGVVLPPYRRRGLYRALVHTRLAHARDAGLPLATSHAREDTSAPILADLGFESVCRLAMYLG